MGLAYALIDCTTRFECLLSTTTLGTSVVEQILAEGGAPLQERSYLTAYPVHSCTLHSRTDGVHVQLVCYKPTATHATIKAAGNRFQLA
jgi:hypothetical protein